MASFDDSQKNRLVGKLITFENDLKKEVRFQEHKKIAKYFMDQEIERVSQKRKTEFYNKFTPTRVVSSLLIGYGFGFVTKSIVGIIAGTTGSFILLNLQNNVKF